MEEILAGRIDIADVDRLLYPDNRQETQLLPLGVYQFEEKRELAGA